MTHQLYEGSVSLASQLEEAAAGYSHASGILRTLKSDKEGRPIKLRVTKNTGPEAITKELEKQGWGQVDGVDFPTKTTAEVGWVDWSKD